MSSFSVRLSKELEHALSVEAKRLRKRRSELIREAVRDYLERQTKQRFMNDLVAEMQNWLGDPSAHDDSAQLSRDLADDDLDALSNSERRAGIDPNARWWR